MSSIPGHVDLVGKTIDKTYEIIAKLGEGGMGVVYEAQHAKTNRRVAIKVILNNFTLDPTLLARFQREAKAAGAVESRHIAQVLDAGADPDTGAPYLVMELLKGRDVDQLMKHFGVLRPTLALRLVAQALAGLERAHGAKVIHRDVKPANLYVAESDGNERVVKIVDFGVAKVKDDVTASRDRTLTRTSSLLGSPLYMSPEQARTSKSVDGRADIWSLGTVLYQLLSGDAPHHLATSLTELLLAICTEPAVPVQKRAPWVPPEIAAIVGKSLEIEVDRRYANASAMLADIEAILPDWPKLDESMITPMSNEERAFVAKVLETPANVLISTGPNSTKSDAMTAALGSSPLPLDRTTVNSVRPKPEAFAKEASPASKPKRSLTLPVGIGVVGLAIAGGIYAGTRTDPPQPAPLVPATVTVTVTVSAPPLPLPSPEPLAAPPPPEPKPVATPKPGVKPSAAPAPAPKPSAAPVGSSPISRDFQ